MKAGSTPKQGRYIARTTSDRGDIIAAQRLRARCFGLTKDADEFDDLSLHVLIEEASSGDVVCCFRLLLLRGADLPQSYSAQYYELSALQSYDGLMMELGRFCICPDRQDPDILRLAWATLTDLVDQQDVQLLFGWRRRDTWMPLRSCAPVIWRPNAGCRVSRHRMCSGLPPSCARRRTSRKPCKECRRCSEPI